ncbi:MAG: hypothetical protein RR197_05650, partial [Oscillospiraceae bacterium]
MRQKAGLYKPMLWVMGIALLTICGVTYFLDRQTFYIVAVIAGVAVVCTLGMVLGASRETDRFVHRMGEAIGSMQADTLLNFPIPVVVANDKGEILWYNEQCAQRLLTEKDWYGRPISELIGVPAEARQDAQTFCITYRQRDYTVFAAHSERDGVAVIAYYLVDDTEMKRDAAEYHDTRPSIWMIMIDSFDEVLQNAKENERSQLLAQVEYLIEKFVGDQDGMVIKTDRDRFVAVLEERYMGAIVSSRFELLDQVRALNAGDKLPITLSIGVSRNVPTYGDGDQAARQALDMAQGRGGDQAAVKTQVGYDFYGGLSKGVEKRTKVKTRIVATALAELIGSSTNVVIMGHKFADLDCLGAAVGLMKPIRQMEKPCIVAISRARNLVGPLLERLEQNGYENSFLNPAEAAEHVTPQTLLIVVDT